MWILWLCNLVSLLPLVTKDELVRFCAGSLQQLDALNPADLQSQIHLLGTATLEREGLHRQHSSSICRRIQRMFTKLIMVVVSLQASNTFLTPIFLPFFQTTSEPISEPPHSTQPFWEPTKNLPPKPVPHLQPFP